MVLLEGNAQVTIVTKLTKGNFQISPFFPHWNSSFFQTKLILKAILYIHTKYMYMHAHICLLKTDKFIFWVNHPENY